MRVDPDKLVSYGLNIGQVEQQLANNNVNAGGSFIEAGLQQINVRDVGLVDNTARYRRHRDQDPERNAGAGRDIADVAQGPKSAWASSARRSIATDGKIVDNADVVSGIVLLRKGADSDATLDAIHDKVQELNEHILPHGVKVVPFLDRSDLVHYTTHTVLHNLTEGIILVVDHPVPVPRQCPRRADCGADHSLLAAVRLHLSRPAATSRRTCSRWARSISAWWWMARW